jgi:hypothetical protein
MPLKKKLFYPYAFADKELNIEILDVKVDGISLPGRVTPENLAISLLDLVDWEQATLKLKISLPEDAISTVLPEYERSTPPLRLRVILSCEKTRWRRGYALSYSEDRGTWSGSVEINRAQLRETVKLVGHLVRTVSSPSNYRFANRQASRVASSQEWHLYIDAPSLPPGNHLEVRWEDFKVSEHPVRAANPTLMYYLDFSETQPVLWLNEGISDFKPVLMSLGTVGSKAAVRNTLFDSISQTVWISLVLQAANAAPDADSDPPEDWQRGILLQFAPFVFRDCTKELAVRQFITAAKDAEQIPTLIESMIVGAQAKLNLVKSTNGILSILESNDEQS